MVALLLRSRFDSTREQEGKMERELRAPLSLLKKSALRRVADSIPKPRPLREQRCVGQRCIGQRCIGQRCTGQPPVGRPG